MATIRRAIRPKTEKKTVEIRHGKKCNIITYFVYQTTDYPVGSDIDTAKESMEKAAKVFNSIKEFKTKNVNLICRGSSGAIMAALFAAKVNNFCTIVHVKKPGESSHKNIFWIPSVNSVNVIIDDFISTGETVNAIYKYAKMYGVGEKGIDVLIVERATQYTFSQLDFVSKYLITAQQW